jgi:MoaA/NifB/PqqE/SkfB family radical SAM enzyme
MPVPYSSLNPVALELEGGAVRKSEGAGLGWLYVEPDGDVLPEQGINQILGNYLNDDWDKIWKAAQEKRSD